MYARPSRARLMDYREMVDGCDAASVFGYKVLFVESLRSLRDDMEARETIHHVTAAVHHPFFRMAAAAGVILDYESRITVQD